MPGQDLNAVLTEIARRPGPLDFTPGSGIISVGDLDSDEVGTGARSNADKLAVELIPVRHWVHLFWTLRRNAMDRDYESAQLISALAALAAFQEGDYDARNLLAPIPPVWYEEACRVFVYGTKKYRKWNWLKGMPWSVPLASAVRHVRDVLVVGEEYDQESGLLHVGHFTCNIMMLAQYSTTYRAGNDLPNPKYFREEKKSNE